MANSVVYITKGSWQHALARLALCQHCDEKVERFFYYSILDVCDSGGSLMAPLRGLIPTFLNPFSSFRLVTLKLSIQNL